MRNTSLQFFLLTVFSALLLTGCVQGNSSPWSVSTTSPRQGDGSAVTINQDVSPQTTATATANTKIGFIVPMSGRGADVGSSLLNAAQLAMFDMNVQNIELIPVDTKGSRQGAYNAAQEALQRGADVLVGPLFAEDVKAVDSLSSPTRPAIGFTTDWTAASSSTFVMGFLPHAQVERILGFEARRGKRSFAFIVPQTEYGRLVSSAGQRLLKGYNLKPAKVVNSAQELVSYMQSGQAVDDVLIAYPAPEASQMVSTILATGQKPQILGTGLWDERSAVNYPSLNGAIYASPSPVKKDKFERDYRRNYGRSPDTLTSLGYDATAMIISLARQGMKPTAQALTRPEGFEGYDGYFRFRPDGLIERSLAVIRMNKGSRQIVENAGQLTTN